MRRPLPAAVSAAVLALVLSGCGGESDGRPTTERSAAPTPIGRIESGAVRLARVAFCPVVPDAAVRDALGGKPDDASSWSNGEQTEVDGDRSDVVHEFGCAWTRDGSRASAWVFARPVTAGFARAVLAKTARRPGCRARPGPGFGSPSQRQVCTLADGSVRVRVSGLFADTWLTCQVSGPPAEPRASLTRRTDAWCVRVVNATNTAR